MRFLKQAMILMLTLHCSIGAGEIFIPPEFEDGRIIEKIIFISDVDGVVREGVDEIADVRVIEAVKKLLECKNVDVAFVSGTPVENKDSSTEPWRKKNLPLKEVFGTSFESEVSEGRVTIFGLLGAQRMKSDGSVESVEEYTPEMSYELQKLLLHGFLQEVLLHGDDRQKNVAYQFQAQLDSLGMDDCISGSAEEQFEKIVLQIREHLDPNFRLICHDALIETHSSNPPWSSTFAAEWLHRETTKPEYLVSSLEPSQRKIATGFAKKEEGGFNYLLIGKTHKGVTVKKHVEEKIKHFPDALIVTVGDTQVDFPMHEHAHVAFHVGLEHVWADHSLPRCIMVRDENGKDSRHVEGTLKVIRLLIDGIGKSFDDLRYIPRQDSSGQWNYRSLNDIRSSNPG